MAHRASINNGMKKQWTRNCAPNRKCNKHSDTVRIIKLLNKQSSSSSGAACQTTGCIKYCIESSGAV